MSNFNAVAICHGNRSKRRDATGKRANALNPRNRAGNASQESVWNCGTRRDCPAAPRRRGEWAAVSPRSVEEAKPYVRTIAAASSHN